MSALVGFAGHSGAGKTTLLEQVIALLRSWGLRVAVIKHAHHHFEMDTPGKDSWRHRQAGAQEVLIASERRWALLHELGDEAQPGLESLLRHLAPCDLVLVEGFKQEPIPKLEVWRAAEGSSRLSPNDPWIIALVTDQPQPGLLPCLDIQDPEAIARFLVQRFDLALRPSQTSAGTIRLKYFAQLRESLQRAQEILPIERGMPVTRLLTQLRSRGGVWAECLAPGHFYRVAINQEMVPLEALLQDQDEVALLPPVTGG